MERPHRPRKSPLEGGQAVVALSLRGEVLASASETGQVQLWNAKSGKRLGTFSTAENLRSLCLHPDGQSLAVSAGGNVSRWDTKTGKQIGMLPREPSEVLCVAHSPDGKQLFLSGAVRRPGEWGAWFQRLPLSGESQNGGAHACLDPAADWLTKPLGHRIAWRPDSSGAVCPSYNSLLGGFEGTSVLCSGIGAVAGLAFTPEGKYLIVARDDGQIVRVTFQTQQREVLADKLAPIRQFALSPDGKAYAVADDRWVSIRPIRSCEER